MCFLKFLYIIEWLYKYEPLHLDNVKGSKKDQNSQSQRKKNPDCYAIHFVECIDRNNTNNSSTVWGLRQQKPTVCSFILAGFITAPVWKGY